MCLFSKTWIPKIAFKDIKVYKVVIQTSDKLITPYRKYEVSKIMRTSFIDCIKGILNIRRNSYNEYEIGYGFIHSCKSFQEAQFIKFILCYHYPNNGYEIITGTIPKGSLYYEHKGSCCSNKLILDL